MQEITNCINCIQKLNTVRKDQHVFHRTLETKPWSRVYIDLVGPLPENEYRGQRVSYLLTMMDGFTKWAEAIPVGEITARSVAKVVLEQWVARYGIPDQIHSDQVAAVHLRAVPGTDGTARDHEDHNPHLQPQVE